MNIQNIPTTTHSQQLRDPLVDDHTLKCDCVSCLTYPIFQNNRFWLDYFPLNICIILEVMLFKVDLQSENQVTGGQQQ